MIYFLFYAAGIVWINMGASLHDSLGRFFLISIGQAIIWVAGIQKGRNDASNEIFTQIEILDEPCGDPACPACHPDKDDDAPV